ncbi:hypothetical protein GCM10007862_29620 [Dyella lipolytica]|nr:hypothetical protein GCM10007862_29620 [Dyella lipolytica]
MEDIAFGTDIEGRRSRAKRRATWQKPSDASKQQEQDIRTHAISSSDARRLDHHRSFMPDLADHRMACYRITAVSPVTVTMGSGFFANDWPNLRRLPLRPTT